MNTETTPTAGRPQMHPSWLEPAPALQLPSYQYDELFAAWRPRPERRSVFAAVLAVLALGECKP